MFKISTFILCLWGFLASGSPVLALAKYVNGEISYDTRANFDAVPSDSNYLINRIQIQVVGPENKTITHDFSPRHDARARGAYKPTKPGTYRIRARARIVKGDYTYTSYKTIRVTNRNPVVSTFTASGSVNMGERVTIQVNAHDPDKNLREVRVYRKRPKSGSFQHVKTLSAVNSELVDTTFTYAVEPGNGSGEYRYYAEAIDAVGAKKRSATRVSTAINPRKTYVIKSRMYPKPGMEGWFSPGPVTTTTVHVRKYRE
mgnify:CR=1 FL=1